VYRLAPNIDLAFAEAGPDPADRVRAVAAAGFDAIELFGTLDKDVPALKRALDETGVSVVSTVAMPYADFVFPRADLRPFFDGLDRSLENTLALGSPRMVVTTGVGFPGLNRAQNLDRLAEAMANVVERTKGSGVLVLIEAVNTKVDHPGSLVERTAEAVQVARAVGDPTAFGITYDAYHSLTGGEDPAAELANAGEYVGYVELAEVPGRGAPGTAGAVDWRHVLATVRASGYDGPIGLEVFETGPDSAAALERIRTIAAEA
jgi:hydroxypyruvate isomerase